MKYRDIGKWTPGGAGCLIYATETSKFLLLFRSDLVSMPWTWGFPGGKIDAGERPAQAAGREVFEETGWDIGDRPMRLIHINSTHAPRFRFYTFAVIVDQEFEPRLNWESQEHRWCSTDDIPGPLHWGVQQTLENQKAGKIFRRMLSDHK
jgi:8-oxo-dGTP pyrophosphatase MutT (NUDIX family)